MGGTGFGPAQALSHRILSLANFHKMNFSCPLSPGYAITNPV